MLVLDEFPSEIVKDHDLDKLKEFLPVINEEIEQYIRAPNYFNL